MAEGDRGYVELSHEARAIYFSAGFSTGYRGARGERSRRRLRSAALVGEAQVREKVNARIRRDDGGRVGITPSRRGAGHSTRRSGPGSTNSAIRGIGFYEARYICYPLFLFTAAKSCTMFTLLSRGSQPALRRAASKIPFSMSRCPMWK